jgi:hypothetical protein
MRIRLLLIARLGLLAAAAPAAALVIPAGRLSGSAEWRYGQFQAEEDGREVIDGAHFAQQYSLLYQMAGRLNQGRAGGYNLALGYEVTALDFEVNDDSESIFTHKLLYQGDLLVAPGGLPFRMRLYADDLTRSQFVRDRSLSRGSLEDAVSGATGSGLLDSQLLTDVFNGTHRVTGATLVVGIRNGSYLGLYRDVLSQLPRLLVDYRQEDVRDLESFTPQHYRRRELAFVSLNKKDNWFHYRHRDYADFINPGNDTSEKSYMLGTINENLQRQWINLTNWIKVSADGAYTVYDRVGADLPVERRYDLNLFATTRRSNWRGGVFSTFERSAQGDDLEKEFEVPLFLSGELSRQTAWRFNFIGSRDRRQDLLNGLQSDEDILYAAGRLDTFRQGRYILSPLLEAEAKQGERGEGGGVKAGVEMRSNKLYKPRYELLGSYALLHLAGTDTSGDNVDYWEHQALAQIATNLTARVRTGIEEEVVVGTGALDRSVSSHITPRGNLALRGSLGEYTLSRGDVLRSTTTWFGEHHSARRLDNRLEATYDYRSLDGEAESQIILSHNLRYDRRTLAASLNNQVILGDNQSVPTLSLETLPPSASAPKADRSFRHNSQLRYLPGRTLEATLDLDYNWFGGASGGSQTQIRGKQMGRYSVFTINGIIRKVAEFSEEIEYERIQGDLAAAHSATTFTLAGDWFPTKIALLGAKLRYRLFSADQGDELAAFLRAGLNFQKLQISLDYGYGTRAAASAAPERVEHRWEMVVKKLF